MEDEQGFAAFMEVQQGAVLTQLKKGQRVSGTVSYISTDTIFVALGARADGRIPRQELLGQDGTLHLNVGDPINATVLDPDTPEGPLLGVTMGKDRGVDLAQLQLALETETPVQGRFSRALKGGLEVDLAGVRGFCPASQADASYVHDLEALVGQETTFLVLELKDGGRSVVVSRKAAVKLAEQALAQAARERLAVGAQAEGTVVSIKPYGAFIDLGGVTGLLHVSEMAQGRVSAPEDVLSMGETVAVTVVGMEDSTDGPRIRLSMKSQDDTAATPNAGGKQTAVLTGKVVRFLPHGLIVSTEAGEGFVPKRELDLPPGADHRRAFAIDQTLEVASLGGTGKQLRFSATKVQEVLANQAFEAYRSEQANTTETESAPSSLAAQLSRLNLGPLPAQAKPTQQARPKPKAAPKPAPSQSAPATSKAAQVAPKATQTTRTQAPAPSAAPSRPAIGQGLPRTGPAEPPQDDPSQGKRRRIVRSR